MKSFLDIWKNFSEVSHYDLKALSDEEVSQIARHYMKEGLHQMSSPQRMHVFITEMNERSSARVTKVGKQLTIVATVIACVSVFVGIVQLIVALKK